MTPYPNPCKLAGVDPQLDVAAFRAVVEAPLPTYKPEPVAPAIRPDPLLIPPAASTPTESGWLGNSRAFWARQDANVNSIDSPLLGGLAAFGVDVIQRLTTFADIPYRRNLRDQEANLYVQQYGLDPEDAYYVATARQLPVASSVLAGEELWKESSNSAFDMNRPLNTTEYGQRLADVGGNLSFLGAGAVDALGIDRPITVVAGLRRSAVISADRAQEFMIENGFTPARALDFADSFDGPITARIAEPGEGFLRYTDVADSRGSFLTTARFSSPAEAVDGLYLKPYGNSALLVQEVTASGRSIVLEGAVQDGGPGIRQTLIIDRSAFQTGTGKGF